MSENDRTRLLGTAAPDAVASAGAPAETARVLSQKYRVGRHIGSGGMGAVFEAVHVVTGKHVAVKVLNAEGASIRERFVREAQTAGRVKHPNIVDVYDVAEDGAEVYLVMELLVGEPLRARIARGAMEPQEAVSLLMPALRGVAAAHARGVVHRDLKPDNIFLCDRGAGIAPDAKVLDFGLSKDLGRAPDARPSNLTVTNVMLGTPLYMAPEQAQSSKAADHRADVYALGLILYEMISGRRLLAAHAHEELAAQIANDVPPFRRDLPDKDAARALERVLMGALTKGPDERMQSVEEFAHAIEAFGHVGFEGGLRMSMLRAASPASVPAPPAPPVSRVGPLAWSALALLVLAAAGWVALRLSSSAAAGAEASPASVDGAVDGAPTVAVSPAAAPEATPVAPAARPTPRAPPAPAPQPASAPIPALVAEPAPVPAPAPVPVAKRVARAARPSPERPAGDAPAAARPTKAPRSASGSLDQDDF